MPHPSEGLWLPSSIGLATVSLLLTVQSLPEGRAMAQEVASDGVSSLVGSTLGVKVVESWMGDLSGEGREDALLVVESAPDDKAGESPALQVVLMRRDAAGQLHRVAANARLLGGAVGAAPGERLRARPGSFTVIDSGNPNGMTAEYRFDYDAHAREWFVAHISRTCTTLPGKHIYQQELGSADLGHVPFSRFDPARLPILDATKNYQPQ